MKQNLIISLFAAALLGSGVANAAETLYASQYDGSSPIDIGPHSSWDTLVMDEPLWLTGQDSDMLYFAMLYNGATIEFQKNKDYETINSLSISLEVELGSPIIFSGPKDIYNFTFDAGAEEIIAASAGTPIMLIEDLNTSSFGFHFMLTTPSDTTLKLNGVGYDGTVVMNGIPFKYVGPKANEAAIMQGEIGILGYAEASRALSLVAKAPAPVPEPTTGSLSLLALVALAARRRRK